MVSSSALAAQVPSAKVAPASSIVQVLLCISFSLTKLTRSRRFKAAADVTLAG
jgi:hypothetical protein